MKRYPILWIVVLFFPLLLSAAEKNKGKLSNLVCFLRFNDEDNKEQFDKPISYYETMFNAEVEGANSVYGYFREASYNQLFWKSSFFPKSDGTQIISYKAKNERGYYREKNSINDLGYSNETEKAAREQALIKELAAYLSENLPDDVVIDANNDGLLDNICIIVSGNSDLSSKYMLWPHRSDLALPDEKAIYVKGKKIVGYLMVFNDANGWSSLSPVPLNTGVLCHEMSHTLGTYDLYHVNDNLNPVGVWDLMSDNLTTPQQMSAYTKYRYCKWIDEIPEISTPGTYTLNPVGGTTKENIAYKIKPTGSDEYFIVEYRRKDGTFDRGLPSSGLLVYRINPNVTGGNLNYNGTTRLDEQYLFRPGGTVTLDGDISKAVFSAESGRTAIGGNAELKPFYSDGKEAKFALANISSCGETISFDLLELTPQIYIPKPNVTLGGAINSTAQVIVESDVAWRIVDVPDWLTITPLQGEAGQSTIVLQAKSANENAQLRIADFHLQGVEDPSITAIVNVAQRSDLIQSPSALTAKEEGNTVVLTWVAPHEGTPALMEDFEDSGNLAKWTIKNEGNRGWLWQKNEKYKEPYAGNYSMRLLEAWEDIHQDEYLISPVFANGKSLTFYSKSTAPQKNNPQNFYYVEVSSDGGTTWKQIWDLKTDCSVVNKYTCVDIDLSPYMSDNMKIAFHAYDTNQTGLSYWWHIDDVAIYPQVEHSMITGYAIYRNGEKIGNSVTSTFTDIAPLSGENVYTVRAEGAFGDTPDSESVTVSFTGTGICKSPVSLSEVTMSLYQGMLHLESENRIETLVLYSLDGKPVLFTAPGEESCDISINHLEAGVYIAYVFMQDQNHPVIRKLMLK